MEAGKLIADKGIEIMTKFLDSKRLSNAAYLKKKFLELVTYGECVIDISNKQKQNGNNT